MKAELASTAERSEQRVPGSRNAMESARAVAEQLLGYPELADLLGIRHRMIANDWRAAELSLLGARHLRRALAVLERVESTPAALRADLAGERHAPRYLFSAAELIDRAVDFCAEGSILSRDNERSWRVFRERVAALHTSTTI